MNVKSLERSRKLDDIVSLVMVGVLSVGMYIGGSKLYKDIPRIYRDVERCLSHKYSSQINL